MDSLVLRSVNSDTTLTFTGRTGEHYEVRVDTGNCGAKRIVETPPYLNNLGPARLFRDAACHCKGWEGSKSWESSKGELRLEITTDRVGHVFVVVQVGSDFCETSDYSGPDPWRIVAQITLEAGQLKTVARQMKSWFSRV